MKLTDTLPTLFHHNRWANLRILERCSELSEEQLTATTAGAYGTIQDTIQHIIIAEQSYLSRISTGQPYRRPKGSPPLTIPEMTDAVRASGSGLIEWASRVKASDVVQVDWDGTPRDVPKTIILTNTVPKLW
jgi:uncharacterized damage-inducible protein DinB